MNALIIYDSKYGNTEKIAKAVSLAIECKMLRADELVPGDLKDIDLLIIGSPTHGGFPSESINGMLKEHFFPKGIRAAAFDTRTRKTIFGYAAKKIAKNLEKSNCELVAPPEGFIVQGMQGPLMEGEIDHATEWAKKLIH